MISESVRKKRSWATRGQCSGQGAHKGQAPWNRSKRIDRSYCRNCSKLKKSTAYRFRTLQNPALRVLLTSESVAPPAALIAASWRANTEKNHFWSVCYSRSDLRIIMARMLFCPPCRGSLLASAMELDRPGRTNAFFAIPIIKQTCRLYWNVLEGQEREKHWYNRRSNVSTTNTFEFEVFLSTRPNRAWKASIHVFPNFWNHWHRTCCMCVWARARATHRCQLLLFPFCRWWNPVSLQQTVILHHSFTDS